MFLVTHTAVGALIGQMTGNPVFAAIGGLVSHFLLDLIPHGDAKLRRNFENGRKIRPAVALVTLDSIIAILFVILLFNFKDFLHPASVSLGIAFAVLPDALVGLCEIRKVSFLDRFYRLHFFFHKFYTAGRRDMPFKYGLVLQALIFFVTQFGFWRWFLLRK